MTRVQRRTNHESKSYGGQRERNTLTIRTAYDVGASFGAVGPAGGLFPDQPGLQYSRRSQYYRHSTVKPWVVLRWASGVWSNWA
jgi:hypothetical protein